MVTKHKKPKMRKPTPKKMNKPPNKTIKLQKINKRKPKRSCDNKLLKLKPLLR